MNAFVERYDLHLTSQLGDSQPSLLLNPSLLQRQQQICKHKTGKHHIDNKSPCNSHAQPQHNRAPSTAVASPLPYLAAPAFPASAATCPPALVRICARDMGSIVNITNSSVLHAFCTSASHGEFARLLPLTLALLLLQRLVLERNQKAKHSSNAVKQKPRIPPTAKTKNYHNQHTSLHAYEPVDCLQLVLLCAVNVGDGSRNLVGGGCEGRGGTVDGIRMQAKTCFWREMGSKTRTLRSDSEASDIAACSDNCSSAASESEATSSSCSHTLADAL